MSELYHYGIKGQKHGVRKYQNEDGSLTPEGKIHYGVGDGRKSKVIFKPGEKPNNIVKKAIKQTKNDFKNDMKSKKSTKKSSKMTPEARKEMNRGVSKMLLGVGLGIAAITTLKKANAIYKTCKNIKVASDQFKSDYNSKIIDSDDWNTIGKIKFKDIGYDQDWTDEWRRERS